MAKDTSLFVKKLAHNDDRVRRQALEALKRYLQSSLAAKLDQFEYDKLWKGLYYSMWYCDKPIPQQKLAHELGALFSECVPEATLQRFHLAFWRICSREWYLIDKWRLDKYLMLVRRVFRHMLFRLQAHGWPKTEVKAFLDVLKEYPLSEKPKMPPALGYHVCDMLVGEIEYVIFKDFRDYSEEIDDDDDEESDADSSDSEAEDLDEEDLEKRLEEQPEEEKLPQKEKRAEDSEDVKAQKAKIVSETPLAQLVQPFRELAQNSKSEGMRIKCQTEVLDDERLVEWGLVEQPEEESDDEWTGI